MWPILEGSVWVLPFQCWRYFGWIFSPLFCLCACCIHHINITILFVLENTDFDTLIYTSAFQGLWLCFLCLCSIASIICFSFLTSCVSLRHLAYVCSHIRHLVKWLINQCVLMKNDLEWQELCANLRKQMWHLDVLKDVSFGCLINGKSLFNSSSSHHWPPGIILGAQYCQKYYKILLKFTNFFCFSWEVLLTFSFTKLQVSL